MVKPIGTIIGTSGGTMKSDAGGPRVPDLSHALDSGKAARALSYAKLIPGSRNFASAASFAASLGAVIANRSRGRSRIARLSTTSVAAQLA